MLKCGIFGIFVSLSMFFIIQILDFYNKLQLKTHGLEYDKLSKITDYTNLNTIPIIVLIIGIILIILSFFVKKQ